ncbi:hypothetical protein Tco_1233095, partial [Tanacetum coccineum]
MLKRGSYIPWASRFRRYLNRKRENKKWLNKAIDEGPYVFKDFTLPDSQSPRLQTEDDLKHYEAKIELMNDLERNSIKFPPVTVNTKFLNCLQSEWLKYTTQVRLAKRLTEDSYDDLFDYLSQYKKLVKASRAKKLEKSHDPLALVAHTGSSSRIPSPYYVTHPSSVVDYDDDYQGDAFQSNSEDPLTSAMMLLARAITQRFSNPTNNHIRTSSNTRNHAIIQADRVNIQSINSRNDGKNTRRSYFQEEIIEGNNVYVRMQEDIQYAGSDTRPPMLDRTDFESWQQRIRLYCLGKDNGENIMKSIKEGPFQMGTVSDVITGGTEGAVQQGPVRARVLNDLSAEEKERYKADIRATNILLQGIPKDIYSLINHYTDAKDIWENVKMI